MANTPWWLDPKYANTIQPSWGPGGLPVSTVSEYDPKTGQLSDAYKKLYPQLDKPMQSPFDSHGNLTPTYAGLVGGGTGKSTGELIRTIFDKSNPYRDPSNGLIVGSPEWMDLMRKTNPQDFQSQGPVTPLTQPSNPNLQALTSLMAPQADPFQSFSQFNYAGLPDPFQNYRV